MKLRRRKVTVYLTRKEKKKIEVSARNHGLSLSEYLRALGLTEGKL